MAASGTSASERAAFLEVLADGSGPGRRVSLDGRLKDLILASVATERLRQIWPGVQPVRAVLFDKSEGANWALPWHQDRVIAVRKRAEVAGFRNWTQKAGLWHCEPPDEFLSSMLFTRFHLDASSAETGAMDIAIGSHLHGLVPTAKAAPLAETCPQEVTEAEAGDVLVLSMLTLHRSRAATRPAARRVLRVDFATMALPTPLEWAA